MPQQQLLKSVFLTNPDDPGLVDVLSKATKDYPYFSLAHYYLLKYTPETDHHFTERANKASLHLNNPFLLQLRLLEKEHSKADEQVIAVDIPELIEEKVNQTEKHTEPEPASVQVVKLEEASHGEKLISRLAEEISQKSKTTVEEVADKTTEPEPILFEPLHTTDYFASQGIKLSEDVQPGDKLGKQLKSFTEWLKTMKKVHHEKASEPNAQPLDPAVQHMAEKSNKEEDVLTETMAEVYAQQGKWKKARETYEKLSLLNPAKSAYFAAKIDLIKDN